MKQAGDTIDSFFDGFDVANDESRFSSEEHTCISFWLPREYKEKYGLIQRKSKRKFGKRLIELIKTSIDKIEVETKA